MLKRITIVLLFAAALLAAILFSQYRKVPLQVSGFIEADEIRVGSRVGGRVLRVPAIEGQAVKVGDVLLELEPYDLLARRAEAVARVEEAKAQQRLAQVTYDRIKPAFDRSAASREELDSASAQLELTKATIDAADAQVKVLDVQLGELVIKSPVEGTVEAVDLQAGDLVSPNAPVLSLMDRRNLWVRAYVPENHLNLGIDQEFAITVDSFPGQKFAGKLTYISRQAEFTPSNVQTPEERSKQVFRIKVTLTSGLDVLRPGMAADVWLDQDGGKPRTFVQP